MKIANKRVDVVEPTKPIGKRLRRGSSSTYSNPNVTKLKL